MKWRRRLPVILLATAIWLCLMPVHICDIPSHGGRHPFYVWNLYNHVIAVLHDPLRCLTDPLGILAVVLYSLPSLVHIAGSIMVAMVILWLLKKIRNRRGPNHASHATSEPAPVAASSAREG